MMIYFLNLYVIKASDNHILHVFTKLGHELSRVIKSSIISRKINYSSSPISIAVKIRFGPHIFLRTLNNYVNRRPKQCA